MYPITTGTAAILALFFILLSLRVLALRGNPAFRFLAFDGGRRADVRERAIRGHANFAEYTPLFLILLALTEGTMPAGALLYGCALAFTIGRFLHGIVFCFMDRNMILRVGGMVLTLSAMGVLAIALGLSSLG